MRANIIKKIVDNDELKKELLTNVKTLNINELTYKYEFDLEIDRYLNLQNIESQIEPVKEAK